MVVLMNPKVWPNPKEFNPERFMGDQSKLTNAIFPAFGVGPRACIGKQFALHEAVAILVIFKYLYSFNFEFIRILFSLPLFFLGYIYIY